MWLFFTVLVFIIIFGIIFIMKIRKTKKNMIHYNNQSNKSDVVDKKKQSIFSKLFSKKSKDEAEVNIEVKPVEKAPEIEVLELFPNEKNVEDIKPVKDDVLNLDDLFKTISMTAINDDPNFDFGLRRSDKK